MKRITFTIAWLLGGIALLLCFTDSYAQTATDSAIAALSDQVNALKERDSHFMVVGLATFGFASSSTSVNGIKQVPSRTNSWDGDHFEWSPMFLWRHGDNLLLEFEPSWDGNAIGINWGCVSYFVTNGLILRGGYFVLPFGTYNKRLAAGWIDKLATDPIGVADMPPASDWGIEAEGGFPLGSMKGSYDVSLTTGYQLIHDGISDGMLQNPNGSGLVDNNNNKTITGRLALLPFSNSCLEIGVSGLMGKVGDTNDPLYENVNTNMYAVDVNFVNSISPITINIKGQYNNINVDKKDYVSPSDSSTTYTFDNKTTSYFGQLSLRPTGSHNKIIRNLELAFRYSNNKTPALSLWGAKADATSIGLDYWLSWRTVLKFTYEALNTTANPLGITGDVTKTNTMFLQYSVQF